MNILTVAHHMSFKLHDKDFNFNQKLKTLNTLSALYNASPTYDPRFTLKNYTTYITNSQSKNKITTGKHGNLEHMTITHTHFNQSIVPADRSLSIYNIRTTKYVAVKDTKLLENEKLYVLKV